jgi:AraC-like DNA-binding protein
MNFGIYRPSAELRPFVKYYWTLDSHMDSQGDCQSVLPTGCIQIIINSGKNFHSKNSDGDKTLSNSYICGQHLDSYELLPTGDIKLFAVVFRPHGARLFFSQPIDEFFSESLPLEFLDKQLIRDLEEKYHRTTNPQDFIPEIENYLTKKLYGKDLYDFRRIGQCIDQLSIGGGRTKLPALAEAACLSPRQLQRKFREYIGASPKVFMRIVRFQTAMHLHNTYNYRDMTRLALDSGYYDQSHFIREFRTIAGISPAKFFREHSPGSDFFAEY